MKTTPTAALEAMLNVEPLHLFIKARARSTALKLKLSSSLKVANHGHSKIWNQMTDECPEIEMPCDYIPPMFRFDKSFKVNISSRKDWMDSPLTISTNALPWYTDGSRSHLSGASYHCLQLQCNQSIPLGVYASVFQAEVTGIAGCCSEIIANEYIDRPIEIFIDSQAAIKSLASNRFMSASALECRDALDTLSRRCQVTLKWVPGHIGVEGNEAANELARLASSTMVTGPEPVIPVSLSTLQSFITQWKRKTFEYYWKNVDTARQAKNCITICPKYSKYFLTLSRRNIKRLTDILTGHCSLNYHLKLLGYKSSPDCEKCGDVETAEHYLCHCPAFIMNRMRLLGNYITRYESVRYIHPRLILGYMNRTNRY